MRDVYLLGLGQTQVGEHWEISLRNLAWMAARAALKDAAGPTASALPRPEALFVGNILAGQLSGQEHLGSLVADYCGLRGIEAVTVEAAGASGGMALRQAYLAIASGYVETALAVGVEKFTDRVGSGATAALATTTDSDWEAAQGATPTSLAALLMRRYMHDYDCTVADFAGFSVNAHANAKTNPYAMFRSTLTPEAFAKASMVADPVNMFDTAPDADGAAAVVLASAEAVRAWVGAFHDSLLPARPLAYPPGQAAGQARAAGARVHLAGVGPVSEAERDETPRRRPLVRIAGSAVATDALAAHDRPDLLFFRAANLSAGRAYRQAGVTPDDIDAFELHDAYTVYTALSLEACGLAGRGFGWKMAAHGADSIGLKGKTPVSTFGGLKARGNPGGATGLYQIVEAGLQLRGEAGPNQVADARRVMAQCLGGAAATAVTHILERVDPLK